jgi:SAM-dependent methyltransferase
MNHARRATVVLPAYRSDDDIPTVVRDLGVAAYALRARDIRLEVVLLVGVGSGLVGEVKPLADELGLPLSLMEGPASGAGEAYLVGFRSVLEPGRADLVVTLDANGRHDATQIPRLIDRLNSEGWDVVIGSRWTKGSATPGLSPGRWILGRLANLVIRVLTGTHGIADATTSFRVARIETVKDFDFSGVPINSHSVQTSFVVNALAKGYRVGEAPIIYRPVIGGGGGLQGKDVLEFSSHLFGLRKQAEETRRQRLSVRGRAFSDAHFNAARDLERLGTAKHFFDWVLDEFDEYLSGRVLEVGAGLGTITRNLLQRYPDISIVALEPADNLFADLGALAAATPRVLAVHDTLENWRRTSDRRFDAILYLNVLEHIADDEREIRYAADALRPRGALLVFAPALESLYSELDYKAGHYRRYSVRTIRRIVAGAGLEVISARYFDVLGVLPYYVVYKLLGHAEISGSTLWAYDRLAVPLSRLIQRVVLHPPLGKNVVLVALKP